MQTAVNFLLKYIEPSLTDEQKHFFSIVIEQAKEMEKQQMHKCASFWRGKENKIEIPIFDQYYNETYGSKGSDEKKEYPHSHIYETMNGRYGLSSYYEHDQTDGIFDTYQEAVDFGLSQFVISKFPKQKYQMRR